MWETCGLLNIPKVKLGQAIIWENLSPVCQDPSNVMPESQLEYQGEQSSWLEPAWLTLGPVQLMLLPLNIGSQRKETILLKVPGEQASLICQKGYQFACTFVFHPLFVCLPVVAVLSGLTQTLNQ